MKTIVTHMSPDLDAISAVWITHRYMKAWEDADVTFVPTGETLDDKDPDENPAIIHVDTGKGKFDHHQSDADTCAARLVFEYVRKEGKIRDIEEQALERITDIVNDGDHFRDIYRDDPDNDLYDFLIEGIIDGAKTSGLTDHELVEFGEKMLDYILQTMIKKIYAETEIEKGLEFKSKWGKSLALETINRETTPLAQKKGYDLVVSKSPKNGQVRIKTRPDVKKDLKKIYLIVVKEDPDATWYYHPSGHMLLNGSSKNPNMVPSKLTLEKVTELIKTI